MEKSDIAAIGAQIVLLGLTGVALFIWVAAQGWIDSAGIIVSVLFVVLAGIQVLLAVVWWRLQRKFSLKLEITSNNGTDYPMKDSKDNGSLLGSKGEGDTRHRGNGDFLATNA